MPTQKQKILEKAITKAIDGGWNYYKGSKFENFKHRKEFDVLSMAGLCVDLHYGPRLWPEQVVFNHDFAKALWGEPKATVSIAIGGSYVIPTEKEIRAGNFGWQYHLQQMVIADDPIAYLGANL